MSRIPDKSDELRELVALSETSPSDMTEAEFDAGRKRITTTGAAARLALSAVLKEAARNAEELPDQQEGRKVA